MPFECLMAIVELVPSDSFIATGASLPQVLW